MGQMRVLVVGAGALGGYFGACLIEAGREVTFLARSERAAQLAADGLHITGPRLSFSGPVRTVLAGSIKDTFDLVLLAVKAYGLDQAMRDMAPAIGPTTVILPVLNGMSHIGMLSSAFGAERVLGGMAQISASLSADGRVELKNTWAELVFGELAGGTSARASAVDKVLTAEGFDARLSAEIAVAPNGRFVYTSNRCNNSIVSFAVDRGDGTLTPIGWAPTHANSPRFFGLDPAVKFLYAANADEGFGPPEEKSTDTIVQFSVEANGELKPTGQVIKTNSPCTIVFASV